jgi:SAM-dependent methyltransferase
VTNVSYELVACIVCGRKDAEVVAERDDIREEVEWLWEYHQRRLRPEIPPEHLMDRVAFSERPPLRLVRCPDCGLVYRNPIERAHELREIYAGDAPSAEVMRSLHGTQLPAMRTQAKLLREVLGRNGTGLEVGSYVGGFLAAASEVGLQIEGVDINRDANAFTRSLGFAVHDGELSSVPGDRRFDCVAIWNTFDQLPDPRATVKTARALLSPGGILVVRVPNGSYYATRRRERRAWPELAQNNLLTFPYRWGFSPRAIRRLLNGAGFSVVRTRGDVLVPIADEWTKPWAADEEREIKRELRDSAREVPSRAPWIEVYARVR